MLLVSSLGEGGDFIPHPFGFIAAFGPA